MGAHIEVTAIAKLAPRWVNDGLRIFGQLLGAAIMGGATWFSALVAYEAYATEAEIFSSILYLPEWPGRVLVPLGLAWWTLRMLVQVFIPAERYTEVDHVEERLEKFD